MFPGAPAPGASAIAETPALSGIGGSLALHALLLVLAASIVLAPRGVPRERPLMVDILTPQEVAALTGSFRAETPVPPPAENSRVAALPPAPEPQPKATMIRPTEMLSARELADPRSANTLAMLDRIDDTERMIQLCGYEAMVQIHAWRGSFRPDRIISNAGGDVAVSGETVEAESAAFRSGQTWYALTYQCRLTPDRATVTAFAFKIGGILPPEEWDARNLPDPALDTD